MKHQISPKQLVDPLLRSYLIHLHYSLVTESRAAAPVRLLPEALGIQAPRFSRLIKTWKSGTLSIKTEIRMHLVKYPIIWICLEIITECRSPCSFHDVFLTLHASSRGSAASAAFGAAALGGGGGGSLEELEESCAAWTTQLLRPPLDEAWQLLSYSPQPAPRLCLETAYLLLETKSLHQVRAQSKENMLDDEKTAGV